MKIEKVTLTRVNRTQKTSAKTGKPFTSLGIVTKEYGDRKWLNGFDSKKTQFWKEGDTVEIIVEQKGDFLNFSTPDVEAKAEMVKQETEVRLRSMWNDIQNLTKRVVTLEKMNGIDPQASAFTKQPEYSPEDIDAQFAAHASKGEHDYGNP